MKTVSHDQRQNDLAAIHIAAKQLGLDRETYEALLWSLCRVRSAADLDWAGRKRVLDHLASRGAAIGGKRPAKGGGEWGFVDAQPEHTRKRWRYLVVLCGQAGIARGRQRAWAEGIARQMRGLGQEILAPAPLWSGADLANVITAVLYQVERIRRREINGA